MNAMIFAIDITNSILENDMNSAIQLVSLMNDPSVTELEKAQLNLIPFLNLYVKCPNETLTYYINNVNISLPALDALRIQIASNITKTWDKNQIIDFIKSNEANYFNFGFILPRESYLELCFRLCLENDLYELLTVIKNNILETEGET